jgi:glycosyltransferase involved in cell wall biosynthesis
LLLRLAKLFGQGLAHDKVVRVLLLQDLATSNNWGGVQTMTHTLQLALQKQGFVVNAFPWQHTKFGELLRVARQSDVVVASHNFGPTYCGVAIKVLTRRPLVSWVHGPLLDVLNISKASWWKRWWLKHVYGYVDRFVCVSKTTENSLLGFLPKGRTPSTNGEKASPTGGKNTARCVVIPNGLATLADNGEHFAFDVQTPSTNLSIGYIGRLSEEKRPHLLLEALRHLPAGAQLFIVGDGILLQALEAAGKDLIASGRLKFLGRQASSCGLYTPYQVTLLTSQYEGCPMTALESLACGVPCVALPIPAMRELFGDDAPYLLAHDETPQALATAILNLARIPVKQMQADMARIVDKHSLRRFGRSWQSMLQDLLSISVGTV